MRTVTIPNPSAPPSSEPNRLIALEIAALTPKQQLAVQNERILDILQRQIDSETAEKERYRNKCERLSKAESNVKALKRAKAEMFVSFLLATFLMGVGGAMTGAFPIVNGVAPWQNVTGWSLLGLGFIMSVSNRLAVWCICYFFPGVLNERQTEIE